MCVCLSVSVHAERMLSRFVVLGTYMNGIPCATAKMWYGSLFHNILYTQTHTCVSQVYV